jgi:hypothetical protein
MNKTYLSAGAMLLAGVLIVGSAIASRLMMNGMSDDIPLL